MQFPSELLFLVHSCYNLLGKYKHIQSLISGFPFMFSLHTLGKIGPYIYNYTLFLFKEVVSFKSCSLFQEIPVYKNKHTVQVWTDTQKIHTHKLHQFHIKKSNYKWSCKHLSLLKSSSEMRNLSFLQLIPFVRGIVFETSSPKLSLNM